MLGSLVQVLFNAVDIIVLGNFSTGNEVAAVGATTSIVGLIVNSFVGLSAGANVVLARFLGAKDEDGAKKCIDTAIICSVLIGALLTVLGMLLSRPLLVLTDCPESCIDDADLYLKLYFAGIPAIMLYNFGATIIRASGDSGSPLVYLIISGVSNAGLNVVLCALLRQKVAAVAIATLFSQVVGAVLVVWHLARSRGVCRITLGSWRLSLPLFLSMMRIGIPSALNGALFSLSNLQIQSAINAIGEDCIAGNAVSGSVENLVGSFVNAFSVAAVVFVSQNYGAGRHDRLPKIVRTALVLAFVMSFTLGNAVNLLARPIFSLYVPGQAGAVEYALIRSGYILAFYWICIMRGVFDSSLQAYGYAIIPMVNSIVCVLVFRVIWMSFIYPLYPTYHSLMQCYIVSWTLGIIASATAYFIVKSRAISKIKPPQNQAETTI